jgi:tRNA pseudouridine32 synthase/23S rRNA pseudouridine746 synthase
MLPILFENDDVLAVNKLEGLASIPERRKENANVFTLLSEKFSEKLYVVHRLDKEVSGVILFAKHVEAHKALNEQFSHRQVRKTYLALTHGIIRDSSGTIDAPIRQYGSGRMGVDCERGKPSLTEFSVVDRFDAYTFVKVFPVTGRRHQIRVHLYSIGHPIVGDTRYGDKEVQQQYARLMLHARRIEFQLLSGQEMAIEAPLPDSFEAVMDHLRGCLKNLLYGQDYVY